MTECYLSLQPHSRRPLIQNRRAFTLLEMLVVIGVILVLVAISVLALGKLDNGTKATRVTLDNCRSMLTEFEAGGGDTTVLVGVTGSPGNVNSGQGGRTNAINSSRDVFRQLLRTPKNVEIMLKIPNKQQLATDNPNVSIPADTWKNPIIFVAATGLQNVKLGANGQGGYSSDATSPSGILIKSRDSRPFFASAGPDGDFSTGDDNVYSFEN